MGARGGRAVRPRPPAALHTTNGRRALSLSLFSLNSRKTDPKMTKNKSSEEDEGGEEGEEEERRGEAVIRPFFSFGPSRSLVSLLSLLSPLSLFNELK